MDGWMDEEGATLLFAPKDETKTCPRCGQKLFVDMNVCYGCLYDFAQGNEQMATEDIPVREDEHDSEPPVPQRHIRITSRCMDVTVTLPEEGLLVGRSTECDVVIHDRAVSRTHVRVAVEGGQVVASDLSARNPALLNGVAVQGTMLMAEGDELDVCGTKISLI